MIAMCIYCILKSFPISGMMNIVKPPSQMETIYIFDLWSDKTYVQRNEKKRYCQFFNVIGILKPAYIKRLGISLTRYSTIFILHAFDFTDSTLFIYFTFQFLRWSVARGAPVGRK